MPTEPQSYADWKQALHPFRVVQEHAQGIGDQLQHVIARHLSRESWQMWGAILETEGRQRSWITDNDPAIIRDLWAGLRSQYASVLSLQPQPRQRIALDLARRSAQAVPVAEVYQGPRPELLLAAADGPAAERGAYLYLEGRSRFWFTDMDTSGAARPARNRRGDVVAGAWSVPFTRTPLLAPVRNSEATLLSEKLHGACELVIAAPGPEIAASFATRFLLERSAQYRFHFDSLPEFTYSAVDAQGEPIAGAWAVPFLLNGTKWHTQKGEVNM
jgi:hypothetical protein